MTEILAEHWPLVTFLAIVAVAVLLARLLVRDQRLPYVKRSSLLTGSELKFHRSLLDAVENRWHVHSMVRMADLIHVRAKTPKHQGWFNKIRSKHIDFVLCDRDSMEVLLAIELDDRSHLRPDRVERDRFVEAAFSDAGLPLLRISVDDQYNVDELRAAIGEFV